MLLLHTADLHLGKTFHERDLLAEQEAMLGELAALALARQPSALLLAGDLYDRAVPPPQAVALFDAFLSRVVAGCPRTAIVAIPGNHDSAGRLGFGSSLFERAGVHVRTRTSRLLEPILLPASEPGGKPCAVWALPFLGAGTDLGPGDGEGSEDSPGSEGGLGERGQAALFAAAIARIRPHLLPGAHNVLLAHCFATGGQGADSERTFVGLAEEVDSRLFDCFDYAALGHLHRPQAIGPKARYPGSPLAYSFGEAGSDRGFLLVELGEEGARAEFLAHRPLHGLARLEGSFAELCLPGAGAGHREDFVEIRLTDSQPVLDPAEALRANFPYLLSIKQAAFELGRAGSGLAAPAELAADRDAADPLVLVEDFRLFHREMREGAEASEETLACLRGLVQEALDAAP